MVPRGKHYISRVLLSLCAGVRDYEARYSFRWLFHIPAAEERYRHVLIENISATGVEDITRMMKIQIKARKKEEESRGRVSHSVFRN